MQIRLLRHATLVISIAGTRLLVDPMLSQAEAMDPVLNASNDRRIPLLNLPMDQRALKQLLGEIHAVVVTHVHRDHWDVCAVELLSKSLPIFCQPEDRERIEQSGFSEVHPLDAPQTFQSLRLQRTSGRHGTGETGQRMGPVSGVVITAGREPSLYIAGDTIWCREVEDALTAYKPDVVVVNAGAAAFLTGGPITMTAEDVVHVCRAVPSAHIVAVHMEALNHCGLTRDMLRKFLSREGLGDRVDVPDDGDILNF